MSTQPNTALEKMRDYTDEDAKLIGLPSPGALNYLTVFARQVVGTPFMPRGLGENPNTILAVMLTGHEMHLSPMQSLRSFWLSPDGRLGMYADAMLALMRKAGFTFEWHKYDRSGCEVTGTRPDGKEKFRTSFTVEDAKAAGLYGKEKSPWPKYPDRMCKARCIGDLWRTLASDLGGGQIYTQEEIVDLEADDTGAYSPAAGSGFSSADHRKAATGGSPMGDYKVEVVAEPQIVPGSVKAGPVAPEMPKPEEPKPTADVQQPGRDIRYEIYAWTSAGWNKIPGEDRHTHQDGAVLRGQALANQHRVPHQVVRVDGEERVEVSVCKVPTAPEPKAPNAPIVPSAEELAEKMRQAASAGPEPGLYENLFARIKAIMDKHMPGMPSKTSGARINQFFSGYMGKPVKELPNTKTQPEEYVGPVSALELVFAADPNSFSSGPEQCGSVCGKADEGLHDMCIKAGWTGPLQSLAREIMYLTQNSAEGFGRFLDANGILKADKAEAYAFLTLRKVSAEAAVLMARAMRERGASIVKCIEYLEGALERPILECKPSDVERIVKELLATLPVVQPQEQKPEEADGGGDFLFGGDSNG